MKPVSPVFIDKREFERPVEQQKPIYFPIPGLIKRGKRVPIMSRWEPTPEERVQIAAGADILLTVSTFGDMMQPVLLDVVPKDMTLEQYEDRCLLMFDAECSSQSSVGGEPT